MSLNASAREFVPTNFAPATVAPALALQNQVMQMPLDPANSKYKFKLCQSWIDTAKCHA